MDFFAILIQGHSIGCNVYSHTNCADNMKGWAKPINYIFILFVAQCKSCISLSFLVSEWKPRRIQLKCLFSAKLDWIFFIWMCIWSLGKTGGRVYKKVAQLKSGSIDDVNSSHLGEHNSFTLASCSFCRSSEKGYWMRGAEQ